MGRVALSGTLLLIALTCGCRERAAKQDAFGVPTPPKRVREFLGEDAVAILSQPQKVEVYRVRERATGVKPHAR